MGAQPRRELGEGAPEGGRELGKNLSPFPFSVGSVYYSVNVQLTDA